ncbi:MAG: DsbA family protein [Bacteroidota bacterium]
MQIIYIYDALCGWCYGFSPVIEEFAKKHRRELGVEVLSGGMVMGARVGPIGQVAGYIKDAYKTVEERTGVKFGKGFLEGILEPGTAIFDSLPSALAMTVVKHMQHDLALPFASALQKAVYDTGIEPQDEEAFVELALAHGLDRKEFRRLYAHEDTRNAALQEIKLIQGWGIHGFPTVLLHEGDNLALMAQGYVPLEALEQRFELAKKEIAV